MDLNLLTALDVLLAEGSVTVAARKLGLSISAMSRTLTRLRTSTGDPLLVRAGRKLVLTPHAAALRDRVHSVTREARTLLVPARTELDVASLDTTFTIRGGASLVEMLASALVAIITEAAPHVRLRFVPKHDTDPHGLREGQIDLEIGRRVTTGPEVCTELLFRDKYVAVARVGHPLFAAGARRLAAYGYVVSAQPLEGLDPGVAVRVVVPGFPDAIRVAAHSELVAIVPRSSLGNALVKGEPARLGVRSLEIPGRVPDFPIWAMWHPRLDADAAQRWFRQQVIALCKRAYPDWPADRQSHGR
jgi:DNA-binding transcriptional LysR family regulator